MINYKKLSAFTLVELLVVIGIIVVLVSLSVVGLNNARSRSRDSRRLVDLQQISMALEIYKREHRSYPPAPDSITGLCLTNQGFTANCGTTPYLQKIPADPQGDDYRYYQLDSGQSYRLIIELENTSSEYPSTSLAIGPNQAKYDLLFEHGIDWKDPKNWQCSVTWDKDRQAIKATNYQSCRIPLNAAGYIPIDTNKRYYISAEYMVENPSSQTLYLGTISYDAARKSLPGHPGSFDYFGLTGVQPPVNGVWAKAMNSYINGKPRTGESPTQSYRDKWHPGTVFAQVMLLINYSSKESNQTTYIRNLRFFVE